MTDTILRIALCDDQLNVLQEQKNLIIDVLNQLSIQGTRISTFLSAIDFLDSSESFDLLFLDIEMPGIDGFNLADELKKRQIDTKIIYASCLIERTKESLRHQAFRFLDKPLDKGDVVEVIESYLEYLSEQQLTLVSKSEEIRRIWFKEIVYVESFGRNSDFYLADNSYFADKRRLKYWRDRLKSCNSFYLGTKNHIINLAEIKFLNGQTKEVEFERFSVPLSRRVFNDLKLFFQKAE
ncbi:MAG: LytTR family DNA-binding domain-containing protein [Streptococcaceae bacterium]|nr:LytTR family DNA-binding domain-containing protein [Streptococcaceae bacterium]